MNIIASNTNNINNYSIDSTLANMVHIVHELLKSPLIDFCTIVVVFGLLHILWVEFIAHRNN